MPYTDHTNPDTAGAFNAVASRYDSAFDNSFDRAEEQFIFDRYIYPHIKNRYILDLGCGTGLIKRLSDRYVFRPQYTGVDYAPEMIAKAKQLHPKNTVLDTHRFFCDDMVAFMDTERPCWYDAIVAMYFPLNYCMYPPEVVYHSANRILRPGWRLILVVATPRYAARASHIVSAGNMRRYYHVGSADAWHGPKALPAGMELVEHNGVNYFIERYRHALQHCPTVINQKLFEWDQRRGIKAGATPYMYILNIAKS